jgi:hypothetical protein
MSPDRSEELIADVPLGESPQADRVIVKWVMLEDHEPLLYVAKWRTNAVGERIPIDGASVWVRARHVGRFLEAVNGASDFRRVWQDARNRTKQCRQARREIANIRASLVRPASQHG